MGVGLVLRSTGFQKADAAVSGDRRSLKGVEQQRTQSCTQSAVNGDRGVGLVLRSTGFQKAVDQHLAERSHRQER